MAAGFPHPAADFLKPDFLSLVRAIRYGPAVSSPSNRFSATDLMCRRGERAVFAHLNLGVESGGCLVLRGRNGAGKSTLLRALAGLFRADAGAIAWNGTDIVRDSEAHRARLAFLGHADALKSGLSVRENLAAHAGLMELPADRIETALHCLDLGTLAERPVRHLSAGQRRRAALARLALGGRDLWLLDEPTAALDRDGTARLSALLAEHLGRGGMAVIASHDAGLPPGAEVLEIA